MTRTRLILWTLLGVAGVVATGGIVTTLVAPPTVKPPPPSQPSVVLRAPTAAPTPDPTPPPEETAEVRDASPIAPARPPEPEDQSEVLLTRLNEPDASVVSDAAGLLAAGKVTKAIPALVAYDIRKNPESAPVIIDALGQLAGEADVRSRSRATQRLIGLLDQEKTRGAPESPANVIAVYEALGHTKDPSAAGALEPELRDPNLTAQGRTAINSALTRLSQR